MIRKLCFLSLLSLLLLSCVPDETPSIILEDFSVSIAPGALQPNMKPYALINSTDGEVVDFKSFESNSKLTFSLDNSQRYHVTLFKIIDFNGFEIINSETYTDVKPDNDLIFGLKPKAIIGPDYSSQVLVKVNFPEAGGWANISHSSGWTSSIFNTLINNSDNFLEIKVPKFNSEQNYLIIAENALGVRKQMMLDLRNASSRLEVNFSDLNEIEEISYLASTGLNSDDEIKGFTVHQAITYENQIYRKGFLYSAANANPMNQLQEMNLYFPSSEELYQVHLVARSKINPSILKYFSGQLKAGDRIPLPIENQIEVTNHSIGDFSFVKGSKVTDWVIKYNIPVHSNTPPYQSSKAFIYGESSGFKLKYPQELLDKYSFLDQLFTWKPESLEVFERGYSYGQLIQNRLVSIPELKQEKTSSMLKVF